MQLEISFQRLLNDSSEAFGFFLKPLPVALIGVLFFKTPHPGRSPQHPACSRHFNLFKAF